MDGFRLACPRCGQTFAQDTVDPLVDELLAHLEDRHGHRPPREHVIARVERHNQPG
jgi:hypothetical protein